jgi:hypothetical protein
MMCAARCCWVVSSYLLILRSYHLRVGSQFVDCRHHQYTGKRKLFACLSNSKKVRRELFSDGVTTSENA